MRSVSVVHPVVVRSFVQAFFLVLFVVNVCRQVNKVAVKFGVSARTIDVKQLKCVEKFNDFY